MSQIDLASLQHLKQATHVLHAELDRHLPIARPGTDLATYVEHLACVALWLHDILLLAYRSDVTNSLPYYLHSQQLLRCDLLAAGQAMPHSADRDLPALVNPAFMSGVDYVVKGSTLGGIYLHRKLSQELPNQPLHYFGDAVSEGMQQWQRFQQELAIYVPDGSALQQAEQGAVWAFRHFMKIQTEIGTATA